MMSGNNNEVPATERSPRSPRWDLLGWYKVDKDHRRFIRRLRILQNPYFAILLTRIYTDDTDRPPHNHSRPFWTMALSGSYTERVWPDPRDLGTSFIREHPRLRPVLVRQHEAHQIISIRGRLRTAVLAGRHHGTFYFWTPAGPVDWKQYR